MKNAFVLIFIILLVITGGLGAWYLLGGNAGETPVVTGPPTSQGGTGNDSGDSGDTGDAGDADTSDDTDCPKGVICLGSASIPTIPTIVLGKEDVYAADGDSGDDDQDTGDEQPDNPITVKGNTPQAVVISNKDFKIWSVSWVTKEASTGYIKSSSNTQGQEKNIYDSRDEDVYSLKERFTHKVNINN
ncbi:MAG: hypothetical protein PHS44_07595 [Candidatus Dojkabacteria bacterium]|nr:hypothetical protein [Candidatus Dojkabacteria bacterium]